MSKNPKKVLDVDKILRNGFKKYGGYHQTYLKICQKYKITPKKKYDGNLREISSSDPNSDEIEQILKSLQILENFPLNVIQIIASQAAPESDGRQKIVRRKKRTSATVRKAGKFSKMSQISL